MTIELQDFDAAEYFTDPEAQAELLADAFESGDARYITNALGVIARAQGMTQVAQDTGIKRQQLYKALSKKGNPTLETFFKVTRALGITLNPTIASVTPG